jgi:hypothetical protein
LDERLLETQGAFTELKRCQWTPALLSQNTFFSTEFIGIRQMLPYWINLSFADLMQGTGFIAMAMVFLSFHFLMPSGRA